MNLEILVLKLASPIACTYGEQEKFDSSQLVLRYGYGNIRVMLVGCCESRNTCVKVGKSHSMHVW